MRCEPRHWALDAIPGSHRPQSIAFPCNQFGAQEPGSMVEILDFCKSKYDVSFPVMSKIEVNGPGEHPLYTFLKNEKPGVGGIKAIEWNFGKVREKENAELFAIKSNAFLFLVPDRPRWTGRRTIPSNDAAGSRDSLLGTFARRNSSSSSSSQTRREFYPNRRDRPGLVWNLMYRNLLHKTN